MNIIIPLFLAVVMAAVITVAYGYPYLQAKLTILVSGAIVFVLALVQLMKELRSPKKLMDKPAVEDREHEASILQYGSEFAWLVGFGLAIYLLGFIVTVPLFICSYMKSHGARWKTSIITGVLMSAFYYVLFVLILDMEMYSGVILMGLQ